MLFWLSGALSSSLTTSHHFSLPSTHPSQPHYCIGALSESPWSCGSWLLATVGLRLPHCNIKIPATSYYIKYTWLVSWQPKPTTLPGKPCLSEWFSSGVLCVGVLCVFQEHMWSCVSATRAPLLLEWFISLWPVWWLIVRCDFGSCGVQCAVKTNSSHVALWFDWPEPVMKCEMQEELQSWNGFLGHTLTANQDTLSLLHSYC